MRWFIALLLLTTFCQARELRLNLAQPATAGVSSWYGAREQGKRTASGERFDRHKMTCASRSYPLGTLLIVKYPAKGTFNSPRQRPGSLGTRKNNRPVRTGRKSSRTTSTRGSVRGDHPGAPLEEPWKSTCT